VDIQAELDPENGEIVEVPASEVEPLPSRRRVLGRALGGIGAIIAAAFARSTAASAATGDPILIGRRNSGGSASTDLLYDGPGGGGLLVRSRRDAITAVSSEDGRGLHGIAAQDAGVVGESRGRSLSITTAGVIGTNDFVVGVKGISVSGIGTQGISTPTLASTPRACRGRAPSR
jgi:hypothetical protein